MSSVSIAGDTSGSILLAAPAVAGSSTVTLPITGGTVRTTTTSGTVLQVIQTTTATSVTSTTSASWANTTLSATITPSATINKILVLIMQEVQIYSASGPYSTGMWQLLRDSTVIYTPSSTTNGNVFTYDYGGSGINMYRPTPITWLDSPSTTSAVTYTTQIKLGSNGGNQIGANTNSPSSITLLEIAG